MEKPMYNCYGTEQTQLTPQRFTKENKDLTPNLANQACGVKGFTMPKNPVTLTNTHTNLIMEKEACF